MAWADPITRGRVGGVDVQRDGCLISMREADDYLRPRAMGDLTRRTMRWQRRRPSLLGVGLLAIAVFVIAARKDA